MRFSNVLGVLAVGTVTVAGLIAGCGDDTATTTTGVPAGPPCEPKGAACKVVDSDCIALEDNAGNGTINLRMGQLTITEPKLLASGLVANLVGNGVLMNLEDCNLAGGGTFSWLLQFDTATGKVKTGGAKPVVDPTAGYCFVNETLDSFPIAPITVDSKLMDGKFSGGVDKILVPIYLDAQASTYVIMPLNKVVLDGEITDNDNCIGKYNADTLRASANCAAEPPETLAFTNAGTLNGYITLEDADKVIVEQLKQSLCVLLSGNASEFGDGKSPNLCKRDAMDKIVFKGGWCSTTNGAADAMCADAEKLGAKYAASAVKITGDCK
jgi:hypothetical protein